MIIKKINPVLSFSFIYFLSCYAISLIWYFNGYFNVYNIFFDTDPNANLASFAHGWGRHAVSHAFLEIFAVPIRFVEFVLSKLDLVSNRLEFRELIALSISPFFSALTLVFFYKILTKLRIKTAEAYIFTLIFAVSFSNVLFAIVPETYAISCFFISLLMYYYLRCRDFEERGRPAIWFAIAIFLAGITITNIFIFCLIFVIHLIRNANKRYLNAFTESSAYSICALFLVFCFYKISHYMLDIQGGGEGGADWVARFITTSFYQAGFNFMNLLSVSINTFMAVFTTTHINDKCSEFTCNGLSFTRHTADYLWLISVAVVLTVFSFFSIRHLKDVRWNDLYLISLPIIIFNFLLHTLFGREMFMYTQHWVVPLSLILIPVLSGKRVLSLLLLLAIFGINLGFILNVDQLVALG